MTLDPVIATDKGDWRVVEIKPKYLTLDPSECHIFAPGKDEDTDEPWLTLDSGFKEKAQQIVEAFNLMDAAYKD